MALCVLITDIVSVKLGSRWSLFGKVMSMSDHEDGRVFGDALDDIRADRDVVWIAMQNDTSRCSFIDTSWWIRRPLGDAQNHMRADRDAVRMVAPHLSCWSDRIVDYYHSDWENVGTRHNRQLCGRRAVSVDCNWASSIERRAWFEREGGASSVN